MPGLLSLEKALQAKIAKRKANVALIALGDDGSPDGSGYRFQYFPESVADSYSTNWNPREIPGGSLPIYQWTNGKERTISFEAWFTCDVDLAAAPAGNLLTAGGAIYDRLKALKVEDRNVDIRAAVLWLRSFMMPSYKTNGSLGVPLVTPPRRLLVVMPNSGIGVMAGNDPRFVTSDRFAAIMTQCEVTWLAWFSSGLPRIASVSLVFAQIAQLPDGSVIFPSYDEYIERQIKPKATPDLSQPGSDFVGYPLEGSK